jgi:hypothetical protein
MLIAILQCNNSIAEIEGIEGRRVFFGKKRQEISCPGDGAPVIATTSAI